MGKISLADKAREPGGSNPRASVRRGVFPRMRGLVLATLPTWDVHNFAHTWRFEAPSHTMRGDAING